jgi:hypothetical protein
LVCGVVSVLLVHRGARRAGVSPAGALLGAAVAGLIPTGARLGVSFQPEALTAGLLVFAIAVAGAPSARDRLVGAAAVLAAVLCRYEAWPVAAVYALFAFRDAISGGALVGAPLVHARARGLVALAGAIAVVAPLIWMLHGLSHHGDAWFFLHRVAAYRRALGVREPPLKSLLAYPVTLVRAEPELVLGGGLALLAAYRDPSRARLLCRPAIAVVSLLGFLIVGRVLDGAPTHHAERPLLTVFYVLAVAVGEAAVVTFVASRSLPEFAGSSRNALVGARSRRAFVGALSLAVLAGIALRKVAAREPETSRTAERSIGATARASMPPDARLAVDTPDYGFFAVIAAFGAPERAEAIDAHDPRDPKMADAFSSPNALSARLAALRSNYVVTTEAHRAVAVRVGATVASQGDFTLVRVDQAMTR